MWFGRLCRVVLISSIIWLDTMFYDHFICNIILMCPTFASFQYLNLGFDAETGMLKSMQNLESSITISLSQDFVYYVGHKGNNSKSEFQASGAYIFRPNQSEPYSFKPRYLKKSYLLRVSIIYI